MVLKLFLVTACFFLIIPTGMVGVENMFGFPDYFSLLSTLFFVFGFICNNAFPQPLSEDEEAYYLQRLEEGDEEARNILIEHNLRLVAHIIKKFDLTPEEQEDLISIGTIGLIKAINTYNQNKGTKLATYAARCIENEILMSLRASKKSRVEVSLYEPIGVDKDGNEFTSAGYLHHISQFPGDRIFSERT
ncbi:MAG: RNA polymerase, sigma 28 subunit, FliA/WhiG subfamily [Thermoanaerobacterales bacterium 50_218]|nr:MAG: RNA polymerase, sigma 28 subunit, FliA/WhiG subfamily [Thermoanaerobacterales bacterium 50_218]